VLLAFARHAGCRTDGARVDDRVLAVNELAENTIVHTEAGGTVLANLLCDLMRIHAGDDGTSIRLHRKHEREPST
jgi:hypothetical protein